VQASFDSIAEADIAAALAKALTAPSKIIMVVAYNSQLLRILDQGNSKC